ncbi:MAG TPA: cation-translocating P-type ATPase C-terminal domain-containing protein, partial [Actinomycetes bacterium]|nr:cation-translocating P-type ATPase C-terminal domain-containing protein [Actinomycetes bacterium]
DLLPALALGVEPPNERVLSRPPLSGQLIDRHIIARVFGVLGPTQAIVEMASFVAVLMVGGWRFGDTAAAGLLAAASGTAFATVVLGQLANAFAVRSSVLPVWRLDPRRNRLLIGAVGVELLLLVFFLVVPPMPELLGGSWPTSLGWLLAATVIPALFVTDAAAKRLLRPRLSHPTSPTPSRERRIHPHL